MRTIRLFKKLFLKIFDYLHAKIDHIGYAKRIGVNMGEDVNIYGNPFGMFGTEPWCITTKMKHLNELPRRKRTEYQPQKAKTKYAASGRGINPKEIKYEI